MPHTIESDSNNSPKPLLVDAYDVKRRPRPPGSSWLLDPDLNLATLRWRDVLKRRRLISLASRPADAPIRSRKAFTNAQRKAVCEMAARTKLSNGALAELFKTNRKTISKTLEDPKKWLRYDLASDAKVAREKRPVHLIIELYLHPWAFDCTKRGILITDDKLRAKAMEAAERYSLLEPPRPFACSPKWLRNVKTRLGIVNGKMVRRESTPGLRSPSPEPSEAPPTFSSQPSAEMTRAGIAISSAPDSSSSPITYATSGPHADIGSPLFAVLPVPTSSSVQVSTGLLPIWVQDASPLSTVEHPPPGLSSQTPSHQSSPELYTPDWLPMQELAASACHYEKPEYDGMHDAPASGLDMDTTFLLTDGLISGPPTLPVMQACPGYADPASLAPLDYSIGIAPSDGLPTGTAPFFSPFPDPPVPSSFIWPTNASPTLTSSVDFSAPAMSPTDSLGILVPRLTCVPQEDIDRLAAEMMHWPIEALLDDTGVTMSQSRAAYPCGEMSFGTQMLSN